MVCAFSTEAAHPMTRCHSAGPKNCMHEASRCRDRIVADGKRRSVPLLQVDSIRASLTAAANGTEKPCKTFLNSASLKQHIQREELESFSMKLNLDDSFGGDSPLSSTETVETPVTSLLEKLGDLKEFQNISAKISPRAEHASKPEVRDVQRTHLVSSLKDFSNAKEEKKVADRKAKSLDCLSLLSNECETPVFASKNPCLASVRGWSAAPVDRRRRSRLCQGRKASIGSILADAMCLVHM